MRALQRNEQAHRRGGRPRQHLRHAWLVVADLPPLPPSAPAGRRDSGPGGVRICVCKHLHGTTGRCAAGSSSGRHRTAGRRQHHKARLGGSAGSRFSLGLAGTLLRGEGVRPAGDEHRRAAAGNRAAMALPPLASLPVGKPHRCFLPLVTACPAASSPSRASSMPSSASRRLLLAIRCFRSRSSALDGLGAMAASDRKQQTLVQALCSSRPTSQPLPGLLCVAALGFSTIARSEKQNVALASLIKPPPHHRRMGDGAQPRQGPHKTLLVAAI